MNLNNKDISLISILTVLLVVQKEILAFLPNIQLVIFLLLVYSKKLGTKKTVIIIVLYVLIDALLTSSISLSYTPFIMIGLLFVPLLTNTIFKKIENVFKLGLMSILFSFIYSWVFALAFALIFNINVVDYLMADIYFEAALALSSFISVAFLYKPVGKVFDKYLNKYEVKKHEQRRVY